MPQFLFPACPLQTNFGLKPLLCLTHIYFFSTWRISAQRPGPKKLVHGQWSCVRHSANCLGLSWGASYHALLKFKGHSRGTKKTPIEYRLDVIIMGSKAMPGNIVTLLHQPTFFLLRKRYLGPPHIPSPCHYPLTCHDVPSYSPAL